MLWFLASGVRETEKTDEMGRTARLRKYAGSRILPGGLTIWVYVMVWREP